MIQKILALRRSLRSLPWTVISWTGTGLSSSEGCVDLVGALAGGVSFDPYVTGNDGGGMETGSLGLRCLGSEGLPVLGSEILSLRVLVVRFGLRRRLHVVDRRWEGCDDRRGNRCGSFLSLFLPFRYGVALSLFTRAKLSRQDPRHIHCMFANPRVFGGLVSAKFRSQARRGL
jgi:hypothetical protein